jgi:hypothetical protein
VLLKRAAVVVIAVAALAAAFGAGRWSGALRSSTQQEATYPWDLHRKIGQASIGCDVLSATPSAGRFHVRPQDDGNTLIVVAHDRQTGKVNGFVVDASGRMASDAWTLECPH